MNKIKTKWEIVKDYINSGLGDSSFTQVGLFDEIEKTYSLNGFRPYFSKDKLKPSSNKTYTLKGIGNILLGLKNAGFISYHNFGETNPYSAYTKKIIRLKVIPHELSFYKLKMLNKQFSEEHFSQRKCIDKNLI